MENLMSELRSYQHFIDGSATAGVSGRTIRRDSPAHGGALAEFAAGEAADLDKAVAVARRAFDKDGWSTLPGEERATILNKLADLIETDLEKLAVMEAEEAGKPIRFARGEVGAAAQLTRYAAALAWQIKGDLYTNLGPDKVGMVTREPRGVVGMITPWNFPLVTLFQKLPFALAAGCTVIVKPSEMTSGTTLEVAALAMKAGLPAGVLNVVTGTGDAVGDPMTVHPGIDMISFTGSTRVGKQIARNGADTVKRVALELGGKAANVVFADADVEAALDGVLFGFTLNQGEECVAGTRLLIEASIADEFVAKLVERTKRVRTGLPMDEKADLSCLVHEAQMRQVLGFIEKGTQEGADLVVGGSRLESDGLDKGFFVEPTIFTNVRPDMAIYREEIFGPVLSVTTFETADEAIEMANDTLYGLANGLWTKDVDKAMTISRKLRSGTVFVNTYLETSPQMPFGGFKQSGLGRENGVDGLLEYTEVKSTFLKLGVRSAVLGHTVGKADTVFVPVGVR